MECQYRGFSFDTDQMRAFQTGVATMPTIYVNENGLCFVKLWRANWDHSLVKHVTRIEAMRLAESFRLDDLKMFLMDCHARHVAT